MVEVHLCRAYPTQKKNRPCGVVSWEKRLEIGSVADPDPGSGAFLPQDPGSGSGMERNPDPDGNKSGSGMNISDHL